jgi:general secretion pathway protein J
MMQKSRGFTLIELLVAITVLAIVAVLGWRGLDSIVRARVSLNADLEQTRGLQLAFAQMQSDCSHIAKAADIGNRPLLSAQAGRLTLVRMVFAENQPSRVQVVAYRLANGVLTRRESAATRNLTELDAAWSAALGDTDVTAPVNLTANVVAMPIRSWISDGNGWRAATEGAAPQPVTPGVATLPQPTGLEVSLQLRDRPANLVKVFLLGPV